MPLPTRRVSDACGFDADETRHCNARCLVVCWGVERPKRKFRKLSRHFLMTPSTLKANCKSLGVRVATRTLRMMARRARLRPGITIVIVNWNSADFLRTTLSAIRRFTSQDVSILVVDNYSKDGSRSSLRGLQDCRVMCLPYNVGHGPALDLALLTARTEYVVTLDVDAFPVSDEWLETLTGPLRRGYHVVGAHMYREFAHPCCLAMRLRRFIELNHTFHPNCRDWGETANLGITEWDVGELISMRERGSVLLIEPSETRGPGFVGTVFGGVVYHNFYGTRYFGPTADARFDGISRHDASQAWTEAKERFLGLK
jgi:glycosyl transferase family 2